MRFLGWLLFAASCVIFVLQGIFVAASDFSITSYEVLVSQAFPLLGIGAIVGAGVGALIVSRYPRNLIGWLLLIGQFGSVIGLAAEAFRILAVQGVVTSPTAGRTATYLHEIFGATFTIAFMAVIFMIAPDGQLLSRRWRIAVAVPIASLVLRCLSIVATPSDLYLPGSVGTVSTFVTVALLSSFGLMLLSILLGALALVLRLRRSTGRQRLQLRWISTSAATLALTFVVYAVGDVVLDPIPWILPEATCLAYIFFSVSVGIAIFRYRLYNIDVILSRAIALGVLAVFVTVGYIVVVVAISAVLVAIGAPGSIIYWPSLLTTALVAVAFQPVRQHVLRLADQLVYGNRAAPYEALATLSRRLADSPSPDALPTRVAEAAGRAVGAAGIVVRIGEPGTPTPVRSAVWSDIRPASDNDTRSASYYDTRPTSDTGPAAGPMRIDLPTLVLPVLDMGAQIGSIEVTMPPGRALRNFEQELLRDVATQSGVAFRNALLQAELTAKVEEGQAKSTELAASRRRLLGAEDEARERLAGAIRRNVIPHLTAVNARLTAGSDPGHNLAEELERLIGEIECAQQELRTVCRGVFPALLDRRGLVTALSAQLDVTHPHTQLHIDETTDRRLDRAVEAAGYLFCVEVAPTDSDCLIELRVDDGRLFAAVTGNADWCSDGDTMPWQHSRDRVAALDGAVTLQRSKSGTTVTAAIPLDPDPADSSMAPRR